MEVARNSICSPIQRRDSLSLQPGITVKIHRFSTFRVQKRRQICEFSLDAAHRLECDRPRPDSEGSPEEAKSIRNREWEIFCCLSSKCLERFCGEVDGGGRLTSNDVRNAPSSNRSIPLAVSLHVFYCSCFTTHTFPPSRIILHSGPPLSFITEQCGRPSRANIPRCSFVQLRNCRLPSHPSAIQFKCVWSDVYYESDL